MERGDPFVKANGAEKSQQYVPIHNHPSDIFLIESLSAADVAELVRIEVESNRPAWTSGMFEKEFENMYSRTYGMRGASGLIGFLVTHLVLDELHIVNFAVALEMRRQGYGRLLLSSVLKEATRIGVKTAYLEVRRSNDAARQLYQELGFSIAGTRPGYYSDNGEDALTLVSRLVNQGGGA